MTRNLIAAASAALLAGAGPGFARQSDGNPAAAQHENAAYGGRASVDGNRTRLAMMAPRIFLQSWHRA
jgi:hypothetical protein